MGFDRAVRQRGMAAAAGTRRRGGDRGQRPGLHCPCRGMRRCRMAPLWYQDRLAGPGLLGPHRALPGRRRRNPRLPRSRGKGVQPETERHHQRQRERHGPAQPAPRRTSGRHRLAHALRASRPGAAAPNGRRLPAPTPQAGPADADAEPGPTWPATPPGLPLTAPPATGRPRRTPRPAARGRPRRPWRCRGCAPARRSRRRTRSSRRALNPPDDRFPDPGPLTDLGNGETGSLARVRQGSTNRHAAPPQLCPPRVPPPRPGGGAIPAPSFHAILTADRLPRSVRGEPPSQRATGRPPPSRPRRRVSPQTRLGWPLRCG